MGLVDALAGKRVYLDANVFIYALEGYGEHVAALFELFAALDERRASAVTSELTLAELLVKPFRVESVEMQRLYFDAIQDRPCLRVIPVSRGVLVESARLRASESMRLPDGVHFATARLEGCAMFVSNDLRLRSCHGIEVVRMPRGEF